MILFLHALFGWEFVAVSFAYGHSKRRVRYGESGPYVWLYDECYLLSKKTREVIWLTPRKEPHPHD